MVWRYPDDAHRQNSWGPKDHKKASVEERSGVGPVLLSCLGFLGHLNPQVLRGDVCADLSDCPTFPGCHLIQTWIKTSCNWWLNYTELILQLSSHIYFILIGFLSVTTVLTMKINKFPIMQTTHIHNHKKPSVSYLICKSKALKWSTWSKQIDR